MIRFVLILIGSMAALVGCSKSNPTEKTATVAPGPGTGGKAAEVATEKKDETTIVDLTDLGLRAEIRVPAGTRLARDEQGIIELAFGDVEVAIAPGAGEGMPAKLGQSDYRFLARAKLTADQTKIAESIVASFRQSDDHRAADQRQASALAAFEKLGGKIHRGPQGIELIVGANSEVVPLGDCCGVSIAFAGPRVTAAALSTVKAIRGLRRLSIIGNQFNDESIEAIAANKSIAELVIQRTRVTDAGLKLLESHPSLTSLIVEYSPVRGATLGTITDLRRLKRLVLRGTSINDGAVERLRGSKLTHLAIVDSAIGDRAAKTLAELETLTALDLSGTNVSDVGLSSIGSLPNLQDLRLNRTNVAGEAIKSLKARTALRSLHLADTLLTSPPLGELLACPNLKELDVRHTATGDAELLKLSEHRSLSRVWVEGTDVSPDGMVKFGTAAPKIQHDWKASPAEAKLPTVAPAISLENPRADPESLVTRFAARIKHEEDDKAKLVVSVSLANSAVTDADLVHLLGWKQLQSIDLSGCKKITDAGLAILAANPALVELRLADTGVVGNNFQALSKCANLRTLDLRKLPINPNQLKPLLALKELERLVVDPIRDDTMFRLLTQFPKLRELDLRGLSLTNRSMMRLTRLVEMEKLELASDSISDRALAPLKGMTKLKELRLRSDTVSDVGLANLAGMTELKLLTLSGVRISDAGLQHLRECKGIERLAIEQTSLTDRGMTWLRELGALIELELRNADISDKGIVHLADLKELELIDLTGTAVTDAGLKSFAKMEELRKLILDGTQVTGQGLAALEKSPRLYRLQMVGCRVTPTGLASISKVEALEELTLNGCPITDEGVVELRRAPNLKQLSLIDVAKLTDQSATVLEGFPALTNVFVRGSGITPKGITSLKKKDGLTVHE